MTYDRSDMSDFDFIKVFRAVTGKKVNDQEHREGVTSAILKREGIMASNYSRAQSQSDREFSLAYSGRRVAGLPVFLIEGTARSWAGYPFYIKSAMPAVIEAKIKLADIESGKIVITQNSTHDRDRGNRVLTYEDVLNSVRGDQPLGGEFFLTGELSGLRKSTIIWRPDKMIEGRVGSSSGWHIESGGMIERLLPWIKS